MLCLIAGGGMRRGEEPVIIVRRWRMEHELAVLRRDVK
jgi:hypothetical protein